ncbi:META domain-containing protein [Kineosporia sp. A_224]|uniref:META domain-containing protein n=1 Tax=Kineosporia sp. A_224 TaxID=1962180 RepID=UPI00117A68FA|nr:META domain-containing protein [Kineosporia sp. A_224]
MSRNRSGRPARRPRLLLALALAALALTACGGGDALSTQPAAAGPDGDWVLTSGTGPAGALVLVDGSPVTLTVEGRAVSGRAACNSYSGDVAASGSGFRPGSIAMTEMACMDPAVSALERGYLDAFAAVTRATVTGDRLVLTGEGVELTFGREAPVVDRPLEGTRWVLDTAFAGESASSVVEGSFLRLDGGDLTGNAGCLDVTGAYRVDGDTVTVTDLRRPEGATGDCDQDASVQDSLLRDFLTGPAITATVDGDRLTLMRGDTGYGFTAAP